MKIIDYYEILQVSPDASGETIDEQYRFLLQAFEAGGDADAESLAAAAAETALLTEAYRAIRGAASRVEADRAVEAEVERIREFPGPVSQPPPGSPPSLAPAAGNELAARERSLDPRVVAAFMTGALLAGGILALKYRHAVSQHEKPWGAGPPITQSKPAARSQPAAIEQPAGTFTRLFPSVAASAGRNVASIKTNSSRAAAHQKLELADDGPTGAGRAERPVTADIILAKGGRTSGTVQIGNVEVVYADGFQETWTTRGNCGQAHIAADGTVGWTVYQAGKAGMAGDYDFQPNGTLVLGRRGRIIARINSSLPYIDSWNFLDRGNQVVLRVRGLAGAARIERRESSTGGLLDSVPAETTELPDWARAFANQ